jgi:hypothetical protein
MSVQSGTTTTKIAAGHIMWPGETRARTVTETLVESVNEVRPSLAARGTLGREATFQDLRAWCGGSRYNGQGIIALLDAIAWDCNLRGEPNLVAFVTDKNGQPGATWDPKDVKSERARVNEWWRNI